MAALDHWHPLLPSKRLRRRPVGVRLAGTQLVLFRGANGEVGALEDRCPHRRMRLSLGKVVNHRLQCAYHGWTFDCAGRGESPGTLKLQAQAAAFEAIERRGFVWVKSRDSRPQFPHFDVDGWYNVCNLQHTVRAPLEVTLDNFTEIEHTPVAHDFFGYDLARLHEVQVRFEPTDTSVRVINAGPPKRIAWIYRLLLGVRRRYVFNDDWTTYFSPVYSVYDHWWSDPLSARQALVRWRLYIFFTPLDDHETALTTFAFTKSRYPGPHGLVWFVKWLIRRKLDHEIRLDVRILEGLADQSPGLEGMKLGRFDRVLGLNRERIERIYRGRAPGVKGNGEGESPGQPLPPASSEPGVGPVARSGELSS
jgi:phenylpropionate dioxygenase-like ring-hydroxylating dioxygenase large terminal subunit